MSTNRTAATKEAVKLLSMFDGYNDSVKEIEAQLNQLSDTAFDSYMKKLRDGEEYIPYYMPTLSKVKITSEKNLKIGKKIGVKFFQRLWLTDSATGNTYLTPLKYLVIDLPFRRQQQHLIKKASIPKDNKHVDELTGQVTGKNSKGSSMSFPEMQILYSQGLNESIRELYKFRGGDEVAHRNLVRNIITTGDNSLDNADDGVSRPKSTETLSILLKAAHLANNL